MTINDAMNMQQELDKAIQERNQLLGVLLAIVNHNKGKFALPLEALQDVPSKVLTTFVDEENRNIIIKFGEDVEPDVVQGSLVVNS